MTKTNRGWDRFFFGFALLTIICGIVLIFQKDYVAGIAGSITGFFLIYLQRSDKGR